MFQEGDQFPDRLPSLCGMSEWPTEIDLIPVHTTFMKSLDIARVFQLAYDMQNGTLGNADRCRDVTCGHVSVMGNEEEYLRMIG